MELREVKPLEINKEIRFLPKGVFGYSYGSQIAHRRRSPLEIKFQKKQPSILESRYFFKVEKISENEIRLVGYVSDESELSLGNWKNTFEKEIILTPSPYEEFKNLVQIELDENLDISERDIERQDGLAMTILEIKRTQPETKKVQIEEKDTNSERIEKEEIIKLEPNLYGIGINFKNLWHKIKDSYGKNNKNRSIAVLENDKRYPKRQSNIQIIFSSVGLIIAIVSIPWWPEIIKSFYNGTVDLQKDTINFSTSTINLQSSGLLRSLEPLETGKKISQLPNNVYFFDIARAIIYELESPLDDFIDARGHRMLDNYFEMQKIDNRYYIIGFINDEAYAQIGSVDASNILNTVVFPYPWGNSRKVISIPFDSISAISDRKIDVDENLSIDILDIKTKEIVTNVISHELPISKN